MSRPAHGISDEQVLQVIACPMEEPNDAEAKTVGGYLAKLLGRVLQEQDCFSGKRPFGNSGWYHADLVPALVRANIVNGRLDEEGYPEDFDEAHVEMLLHAVTVGLVRLALLSAAPRRPT